MLFKNQILGFNQKTFLSIVTHGQKLVSQICQYSGNNSISASWNFLFGILLFLNESILFVDNSSYHKICVLRITGLLKVLWVC